MPAATTVLPSSSGLSSADVPAVPLDVPQHPTRGCYRYSLCVALSYPAPVRQRSPSSHSTGGTLPNRVREPDSHGAKAPCRPPGNGRAICSPPPAGWATRLQISRARLQSKVLGAMQSPRVRQSSAPRPSRLCAHSRQRLWSDQRSRYLAMLYRRELEVPRVVCVVVTAMMLRIPPSISFDNGGSPSALVVYRDQLLGTSKSDRVQARAGTTSKSHPL